MACYNQNCNKKNVNNDNYILLSCVCRLASSAQSLRHHHQKDLSTVLQPEIITNKIADQNKKKRKYQTATEMLEC